MTAPVTATIKLEMPNQGHLFEHLKENAKYANPTNVIDRGMGEGKTVIICGAGPSLADQHDLLRTMPAHQVWGCNSALPYLADRRLPVTHGITVDMSEEMYTDPYEWQRTFPVRYLVASGVMPELIQHLRKANRAYRMFHSYLGIPNPEGWHPPDGWTPPEPNMNTYEMYLYQTIYPPTVQVGYGLNTVPRAICLALWMEYKRIVVLGADCACAPTGTPMPHDIDSPEYVPWLESLRLYADGRTPAKYGPNAVMSQGILEGRFWHTRPDMLISMRHLVDLEKRYPQTIELVGDTLPNAAKRMDQTWWDQLPNLNGAAGVEGFHLNVPPSLDNSEEVSHG